MDLRGYSDRHNYSDPDAGVGVAGRDWVVVADPMWVTPLGVSVFLRVDMQLSPEGQLGGLMDCGLVLQWARHWGRGRSSLTL